MLSCQATDTNNLLRHCVSMAMRSCLKYAYPINPTGLSLASIWLRSDRNSAWDAKQITDLSPSFLYQMEAFQSRCQWRVRDIAIRYQKHRENIRQCLLLSCSGGFKDCGAQGRNYVWGLGPKFSAGPLFENLLLIKIIPSSFCNCFFFCLKEKSFQFCSYVRGTFQA